MQKILAGIDYGAKTAGTTAIAVLKGKEVSVFCSEKNKDADDFVHSMVAQAQPGLIAIDAPLSLPAVYIHPLAAKDYFYRLCDRELGCMSPMFLGGLTARAMQLKEQLTKNPIKVIETYPARMAADLGLKETGYKTAPEHIAHGIAAIKNKTKWLITDAHIGSWHCFDALLALYGAYKYSKGIANTAGNPAEGLIYF